MERCFLDMSLGIDDFQQYRRYPVGPKVNGDIRKDFPPLNKKDHEVSATKTYFVKYPCTKNTECVHRNSVHIYLTDRQEGCGRFRCKSNLLMRYNNKLYLYDKSFFEKKTHFVKCLQGVFVFPFVNTINRIILPILSILLLPFKVKEERKIVFEKLTKIPHAFICLFVETGISILGLVPFLSLRCRILNNAIEEYIDSPIFTNVTRINLQLLGYADKHDLRRSKKSSYFVFDNNTNMNIESKKLILEMFKQTLVPDKIHINTCGSKQHKKKSTGHAAKNAVAEQIHAGHFTEDKSVECMDTSAGSSSAPCNGRYNPLLERNVVYLSPDIPSTSSAADRTLLDRPPHNVAQDIIFDDQSYAERSCTNKRDVEEDTDPVRDIEEEINPLYDTSRALVPYNGRGDLLRTLVLVSDDILDLLHNNAEVNRFSNGRITEVEEETNPLHDTSRALVPYNGADNLLRTVLLVSQMDLEDLLPKNAEANNFGTDEDTNPLYDTSRALVPYNGRGDLLRTVLLVSDDMLDLLHNNAEANRFSNGRITEVEEETNPLYDTSRALVPYHSLKKDKVTLVFNMSLDDLARNNAATNNFGTDEDPLYNSNSLVVPYHRRDNSQMEQNLYLPNSFSTDRITEVTDTHLDHSTEVRLNNADNSLVPYHERFNLRTVVSISNLYNSNSLVVPYHSRDNSPMEKEDNFQMDKEDNSPMEKDLYRDNNFSADRITEEVEDQPIVSTNLREEIKPSNFIYNNIPSYLDPKHEHMELINPIVEDLYNMTKVIDSPNKNEERYAINYKHYLQKAEDATVALAKFISETDEFSLDCIRIALINNSEVYKKLEAIIDKEILEINGFVYERTYMPVAANPEGDYNAKEIENVFTKSHELHKHAKKMMIEGQKAWLKKLLKKYKIVTDELEPHYQWEVNLHRDVANLFREEDDSWAREDDSWTRENEPWSRELMRGVSKLNSEVERYKHDRRNRFSK